MARRRKGAPGGRALRGWPAALAAGVLAAGLTAARPAAEHPAAAPAAGASARPLADATAGLAEVAYVANEATGTISVIDPGSGRIIATIGLGSDPALAGTPQPAGPLNAAADHHRPFYNGHAGTHGLWLTPDGAVLLAANRLSGTVAAVDTATGAVLGYTPVGREPHLATVRPGGREAWAAIRGESHIDVLALDRSRLYGPDRRRTDRMPVIATIDTVRGPSMVAFTSDGRHAFVAAGKEARVDKIDAGRRRVVASRQLAAPFTPFGLVAPDDRELWLVHKGAGTLTVLRTRDLAPVAENIPVGPRPNHLAFVGRLAYITAGGAPPGPADPEPAGRVVILDRHTHAVVGELAGPAWTGEPHGIWPAAGGRLLVGHERGNRVTIIATGDPDDPADDRIAGVVTGTAEHLGHLRQPIDVVVGPAPGAIPRS